MEQESAEPNDAGERRSRRVESALARARVLLGESGCPALVLTEVGTVAWLTGGVAPPIDRSAAIDSTWAVVHEDRAALVVTEVEAERVTEEYDPGAHGFALVAVPWFDDGAAVRAAEAFADAPAQVLGSDGHDAFGVDLRDDLVERRLTLCEPERDELRDLGALAARALSHALRSWRPGFDRDLDLAAVLVAELEAGGADAPVVIVGGDERLRRFRHPLAVGARIDRIAMAVVVARRSGLHVASTRFALAGPPDPDFADLRGRVAAIDDRVLTACRPGVTYGGVLGELAAAYREAGAEGAWREHYQGGPIGFQQREFELAPPQAATRFGSVAIEAGQAVAWNPSLAGGAKLEDTYLVGVDELELVTTEPGWPTELTGGGRVRAAVLEVA